MPIFLRICQLFPPPEIDLFASVLTFLLPRYYSRVQDSQAWAIDAMSCPWTGLCLYFFPPFSLLPRVLQKVAQEGADLLLIAPLWPQRPWFLRLMSLLVDFPRRLPALPDLNHQPISLIPHVNPDRLHLTLWAPFHKGLRLIVRWIFIVAQWQIVYNLRLIATLYETGPWSLSGTRPEGRPF